MVGLEFTNQNIPKTIYIIIYYESTLIAEKVFGKPLPPDAVVHHVNGNKLNNSNNNLVICQNRAYHNLLHRREKALRACGHANWRKCSQCHNYDIPDKLTIKNYNGQEIVYHSSCIRREREKAVQAGLDAAIERQFQEDK